MYNLFFTLDHLPSRLSLVEDLKTFWSDQNNPSLIVTTIVLRGAFLPTYQIREWERIPTNYRLWFPWQIIFIVTHALSRLCKYIFANTRDCWLNKGSRGLLFAIARLYGLISRILFDVSRYSGSLVIFFCLNEYSNICAREGLFLAAKVGYAREGRGGITRWLRAIPSTGRLDAAAPVFKHQMLAEVRSMLRAFLPWAFAAEISPASHRSSICVALLAAISQTENSFATETVENSTGEKITRKTWWR